MVVGVGWRGFAVSMTANSLGLALILQRLLIIAYTWKRSTWFCFMHLIVGGFVNSLQPLLYSESSSLWLRTTFPISPVAQCSSTICPVMLCASCILFTNGRCAVDVSSICTTQLKGTTAVKPRTSEVFTNLLLSFSSLFLSPHFSKMKTFMAKRQEPEVDVSWCSAVNIVGQHIYHQISYETAESHFPICVATNKNHKV